MLRIRGLCVRRKVLNDVHDTDSVTRVPERQLKRPNDVAAGTLEASPAVQIFTEL